MPYKDSRQTVFLDPRTSLLLLFFVTIVVFVQNSFHIEIVLLLALICLFLAGRLFKALLKLSLLLGVLLTLQYYIFPTVSNLFTNTFSTFTMFLLKIFPCLMIGNFISKMVPMRYAIIAMRKWHLPETLIIPLSVTFRYFPAIKEETVCIRNAIRLREIRGPARFEAVLVPLIFSAANTADDLAAAAVTRGIENPVEKTSIIELRFRARDYFCIFAGLIFTTAAILSKCGIL